MKWCLVVVSVVLVLSTTCTTAHRSRSSKCDFNQLKRFANSSSCYLSIYDLLVRFFVNPFVEEDRAEFFCTPDCVGNFIQFLREQWNCKKGFKKLYPTILASLCSRNEAGTRCINLLHPSTNDSFDGVTSGTACSDERRAHVQRLLDTYGCCFGYKFGSKIRGHPERFCFIEAPPLCRSNHDRNRDMATAATNSSTRTDHHSYLHVIFLCITLVSWYYTWQSYRDH